MPAGRGSCPGLEGVEVGCDEAHRLALGTGARNRLERGVGAGRMPLAM